MKLPPLDVFRQPLVEPLGHLVLQAAYLDNALYEFITMLLPFGPDTTVEQVAHRLRNWDAAFIEKSIDDAIPDADLAKDLSHYVQRVAPLMTAMEDLAVRIKRLELEIARWHRTDETSRRLETIPGVGVMTASAMSASIADPSMFTSGREFAAWLGLTPRQNSSGGKERLGGITKMGDRYLRTLLVIGATAVIRYAKEEGSAKTAWIRKLLDKKPAKVVAVALANKMARIAWVLMTRRETYRAVPA